MDMTANVPMMPMAYGNGGLFGGSGNDWFGFLILAMFFGWGGNGFGFGGRGIGGTLATDNLISNEFNFNTLNNGIRGLERGVCELGFNNSQLASQTRESLATSTFALQGAINGIGSKIDSCCCETNRNIDAVRYDMAKGFCDVITSGNLNTRDLIEAGNANTQRIVDLITQNEIQKLRDDKLALQGQLSQVAQTSTIIDALKPKAPIPAYLTQNPCCVG